MDSKPRKNHPSDIMKNKVFKEAPDFFNKLNNSLTEHDKKLTLWRYAEWFIRYGYQKGYKTGLEKGIIKGYNQKAGDDEL